MSDYEIICDITGKMDEDAIEAMIDSVHDSEEINVLKSSYSPTQIAEEIENISTAKELNNLLKKMNILIENSTLNTLLKNNQLIIYYNGLDKKGNKYTQLRWTKAGREYILKALKAYTTIIEPLLITSTQIEESKNPTHSGHYYLEILDQYGRKWSHKGDSNSNGKSTFEDMQKIAIEATSKAIIDVDLFYMEYGNKIKNIKRHEEVLYVYTYDMNSKKFGIDYIGSSEKYAGYVLIVTKDCLEYKHNKIFTNYDDAMEFALKVQDKGIVNLEFWTCLGDYYFENNQHLEFVEIYDDYDDYDDYVTEESEPTYLSDGLWLYPNGQMRDDKAGR